MDKELGTAGKVVTADASSGFDGFKEAVYDFLTNFFSWLSTHQGFGLIIILIVLGIMIYFILRFKKFGKQIEKIIAGNKSEIGKKDALIEEQKSKLEGLQKKMSDQQTVASEAMLKTIMTMTGYNIDQLPIFFKFLTEINGNPLQIADAQASPMPENRQSEESSDDSAEDNDGKEKITPVAVPQEVIEADKVSQEVAEADKNGPGESGKEEKLSEDEKLIKDETFKEDEKAKADQKLSKDEN